MTLSQGQNNTWRILFYVFLALCFLLAAFFNQFGIFYDYSMVVKLLAAIAFCGVIGLLVDFAFRIGKTWFWPIPVLTAAEFAGDLIFKAGFWDLAKYTYTLSAMLWPVFGILFIIKGIKIFKQEKWLGFKFIWLGIMASAVIGWEYVTYFPEEYDKSHWAWRTLYLAIFMWLLVIDFTTDFSKRPEMKAEKQILRVSLLLIATWYFTRFIFK
jgi:hypothetical protein